MCEPVSAAIIGSAVVGGLVQRSVAKKQEAAANNARNEQTRVQNEAKAQAEALGPAAKAIDLTKEANVYNDLKKNKMALQAGLMGTIKTSPLGSAPTAQTQKTTLGT